MGVVRQQGLKIRCGSVFGGHQACKGQTIELGVLAFASRHDNDGFLCAANQTGQFGTGKSDEAFVEGIASLKRWEKENICISPYWCLNIFDKQAFRIAG
jgi:hypothetical protein